MYVTYKELFDRCVGTLYITYSSGLTLSAKAVNTFTFADCTYTPQEGDILCQGEYAQRVSVVAGTDITVDDATNILDGSASIYRSTKTIAEWSILRTMAEKTVDMTTGQWFEPRTLTIRQEGLNTNMLHFNVPIITVTSLKINNETEDTDTDCYEVYNSTTIPDDRQNPKIKLVNTNTTVFNSISTSVFNEGMYNTIEGTFGYVESDGSTPELIKFCIAKLAMKYINSTSSSSGGGGAIKKEKTDMHEIEYDTSSASTTTSSGTGDDDVDAILSKYMAPLSIAANVVGVAGDKVGVR